MFNAINMNVSRIVSIIAIACVAYVACHVFEYAYTLHVIESCAR